MIKNASLSTTLSDYTNPSGPLIYYFYKNSFIVFDYTKLDLPKKLAKTFFIYILIKLLLFGFSMARK